MNSPGDLYSVLGLSSDASQEEIKRAYKKLALRYHPDKVPKEERATAEIRFKEISHAYSIISDTEKRRDYDAYGERDHGGPSDGYYNSSYGGAAFNGTDFDFSPDDFANFFNGMNMGGMGMDGGFSGPKATPRSRGPPHGPRRAPKAPPAPPGGSPGGRTKDAQFDVEVNLLDLYNGKVIKLSETRDKVCGKCNGTGVKKSAVEISCNSCNGLGYVRKYRHIGGLSLVETVTCETCKGQGSYYRDKDFCRSCKGAGVVKESKILEFDIPKGSANEGFVSLKGESDQSPGLETGDVLLNWKLKPRKAEERFQRHGDDLYTKVKVPLVDALCGFEKAKFVETLDNRWLSLKLPSGKVLRPGDSIIIPNEGMPVLGDYRNRHGDLYVGVDIEFPKDHWAIEKNDFSTLRSVLDISYGSDGNAGTNNIEESNDVTNVSFKVKTKYDLPLSFNSFNANAEVKDVGVENKPKGWFGKWF
ncbi:DEKNAAC100898 [Brettanomyces naardenensis]|uniref:DEKNAAC100898 n=1 Tax=Brettanomyces naardenensis TaxID=13370 RepID=A0A448YFH3_BRENA|nr:DEKNAAC100898 [Brettanomyces naardenensis]